MKLYVIRHGLTKCNIEKKYNGKLDEDINETGILQAKKVQEIIKNIDIDLIICSPLLRTRHTCNIININDVPVIFDNRIEERDVVYIQAKNLENFIILIIGIIILKLK